MGTIRGVDCKVYVNTSVDADPFANPTWSEWECVRDTTLSMDYEEVDATCRGSGGFRQSSITLTAAEVTGNAIKEKLDASFIAIETAARSKTVLDVLVLDGDRTSADTDGWRMDVQIFNWTENQPYEDIVTCDFTLKPARSANKPTYVSGPIPAV